MNLSISHIWPKNTDIKNLIQISEKINGSLLSSLKFNDILEVKTMKSVHSDVANDARRSLRQKIENKEAGHPYSNVIAFVSNLIGIGFSPHVWKRFASQSNCHWL